VSRKSFEVFPGLQVGEVDITPFHTAGEEGAVGVFDDEVQAAGAFSLFPATGIGNYFLYIIRF